MFKELAPVLRHRAVLMTITSTEDDQIRVNVVPKKLKDDENMALTTPITVTGAAEELDAELGNITAPTLSIGCKHDVMRPPQMVQEISKLIPSARYVEADSGHFMHAQSPELFAQMAVAFLLGK